MNQIYINPMEEISLNFGDDQTIDLNDLFYHPVGHDITVTLTNNSDSESLLAVMENNILNITAQNVIGYPILSLHGEAVGLDNDYDLKVKINDPNPTSNAYLYDIGDSPEQEPFPYNTESPYFNTLDDLDWTTFSVAEIGLLYSISIDCYWRSYEHFEAGQLWMKSPAGLEVMVFQPEEDGFTSLEMEIPEFYAQSVEGDWQVWLTDSEGNGGHQVIGLDVTFNIIEPMNSSDENTVAVISQIGNYPNPFNPTTNIYFSVNSGNGITELCIYNVKGEKVRELCSEQLTAGSYSRVWNGKDDNGLSVGSGIYFSQFRNEKERYVNKMILLK